MANCYKCGTQYEGKYCPSCGASAGASQPVAYNQIPNQAPPVFHNISVEQPASSTSVMGWIGWMVLLWFLPVLGLIIMALAATDPSAKNFAKANLLVLAIILAVVLIILLLAIVVPLIFAGGMAASY